MAGILQALLVAGAGSDMQLVAVSVTAAGVTSIALPSSPSAPQAGDFCFVFATDSGSNPVIGDGGGIVGWTANGTDAQVGMYGYGKTLSSGDISTNQITFFATSTNQTLVFVFRLPTATTVVAKGVVATATVTNPQAFSGFALGGSAKEVLFFNYGQTTATLTSPSLPSANTSAPVTTDNWSARWGASALYVSSANISYVPGGTGVILSGSKWELD